MRIQTLAFALSVASLTHVAVAQTSPRTHTPPAKSTLAPVTAQPTRTAPSSHTSFLLTGSDDCSGASLNAISGSGTFMVDTTTATDGTQIGTGCVQPHKDVWFQWTATQNTSATVDLCGGTTTDTVIAAWAGAACPSGAALACDDDSTCGLQSQITFPITSGGVYLIQIGVYGATAGFAGTFTVTEALPPPPPIPASFNVDIGAPVGAAGVPSSAYAAADGLPGYWNAVDVASLSTNLNDLSGTPAGCVVTRAGTNLFDFYYVGVGPTGDDAALMNDAQDVGGTGGTTTWTFSNLFGGSYTIYTYAWAPDQPTLYTTVVSVAGSSDPAQTIGGAWTGAQALGVTYAVHHVNSVPGNGSIAVTVTTGSQFGTLNGFQIVETSLPYVSYCFGDGSGTACPCGNVGATGNGCENSLTTGGGHLAATGAASISGDSLALVGSLMANSSCLYFQGNSRANAGLGAVFGDGLRCATGGVKRLGLKTNSGGGSQYPVAGDQSISVRGAVVAPGTKDYQAWYRNAAAFCTVSTFNLTNGVEITWGT